jgi:6-pyruvoyl-tetrahydropterin synthase
MIELAGQEDEEHRCFNRREFQLDLDDVKAIIRKLKED